MVGRFELLTIEKKKKTDPQRNIRMFNTRLSAHLQASGQTISGKIYIFVMIQISRSPV